MTTTATTFSLDYRVPYEAINLKAWRLREEPHDYTVENQPREESGGEVYVEFIHGFIGKVEYKKHINKDGTWPNLFFMIRGEPAGPHSRAVPDKDMNTGTR